MDWTKLAWHLGLTKESGIGDESDINYEIAVVQPKDYNNNNNNKGTAIFDKIKKSMLYDNSNKPKVHFNGPVPFCVDENEICESLKIGDCVEIQYRVQYVDTLDYVPPDFENKKIIKRVITGYRFVRFKMLDNSAKQESEFQMANA